MLSKEAKFALYLVMNTIAKQTLCRFGLHTPKSFVGFDLCLRGCGHKHNPDAEKKWKVTIVSGEEYFVDAINEWHAASKVVYGPGMLNINGVTGLPICNVKVHRANIATTVQLV